MGTREPADRSTGSRFIRIVTLLILAAPVVGVGVTIAVLASRWEWSLAALVCTLLACGGLLRASRTIGRALRPQKVRYDHSLFTNLAGRTSEPHSGPASPSSKHSGETPDRE